MYIENYGTLIYYEQEVHGPHRSPEKPVQIDEYIEAKL